MITRPPWTRQPTPRESGSSGMHLFVNASDSPLAPKPVGAPGADGHVGGTPLLELVLSLAQVQYDMESRRRGGLSTDALRAVERPLLEELHRHGVPIPQRAPRKPTRQRPGGSAPAADRPPRQPPS